MFMGESKYDMSAQTGEESLILSISSEFLRIYRIILML